jgi:hypothetical protein
MGKVLRPFRRGREAETPGREMCKLREAGWKYYSRVCGFPTRLFRMRESLEKREAETVSETLMREMIDDR